MEERLRALAGEVFRLVKNMDEEAVPLADGYPTGLRWYDEHLRRSGVPTKLKRETSWTQRLAELLRQSGHDSVAECDYPTGPKRKKICDVVVRHTDQPPTWIELKGAWRGYFDSGRLNPSYRKHLAAAADDITKLSTISASDASAVMLVLVGFDQKERPITEEDLAPIHALVSGDEWLPLSADWSVISATLQFRVRVRLWARSV